MAGLPLIVITATAFVPGPTLKLPVASSLSPAGFSSTSCFSAPVSNVNHRDWFTIWRWGKVLGAMLLIGAVMKLSMAT